MILDFNVDSGAWTQKQHANSVRCPHILLTLKPASFNSSSTHPTRPPALFNTISCPVTRTILISPAMHGRKSCSAAAAAAASDRHPFFLPKNHPCTLTNVLLPRKRRRPQLELPRLLHGHRGAIRHSRPLLLHLLTLHARALAR